ncbi:unnamed protein product, partial [Rotaria socialis]
LRRTDRDTLEHIPFKKVELSFFDLA